MCNHDVWTLVPSLREEAPMCLKAVHAECMSSCLLDYLLLVVEPDLQIP